MSNDELIAYIYLHLPNTEVVSNKNDLIVFLYKDIYFKIYNYLPFERCKAESIIATLSGYRYDLFSEEKFADTEFELEKSLYKDSKREKSIVHAAEFNLILKNLDKTNVVNFFDYVLISFKLHDLISELKKA